MRDVKEQKVNSTYQKGLVTSPCNLISGSGLRAIQHYAGQVEQS